MDNFIGIENADGLSSELRDIVVQLVEVYKKVQPRNKKLLDYYEGDIEVNDYGLTMKSDELKNDQVCYWPYKSVEALAERVVWDGVNFIGDYSDKKLNAAILANNLYANFGRYQHNCYVTGCMFATVNRFNDSVLVKFHSSETAAAIPDENYDSETIGAGMAVAKMERTVYSPKPIPTQVNVYVPGSVVVIERKTDSKWVATVNRTPEKQPLMIAFTHKSTGDKPFGVSRINRAVRSLTRDAVRTMWQMQLSAAFYAMPQRYLLGLSDDMFDALKDNKQRMYIDSMLLATSGEDGKPTYGQLSGNSPEPFIAQLRFLASSFSGVTGVPLNSLGIVQDNPSSAEAILASTMDICATAEEQIRSDKASLSRLMRLIMAISENTTTDKLTEEQLSVEAHFRSPMLPSMAQRSDFAVKVGSIDQGYIGTDLFYEQLGFDAYEIERLKSQERENQAANLINELMANGAGA